MFDTILANTACESTAANREILATCETMVEQGIPNLLRFHLNPHVAQTCYCLTRLIEKKWPLASADNYQVFLANSFEEALSGAIKLARYSCNARGASATGLMIDEDSRLEHFSCTELPGQGTIEYIPDITVKSGVSPALERLAGAESPPGFLVAFLSSLRAWEGSFTEKLRAKLRENYPPLLILCCDRAAALDGDAGKKLHDLSPDIVVFDESFVDFAVPFGAFAASKRLFDYWNKRGMATFHSTTYQPNTISTLHFMKCLRGCDPHFVDRHAVALEQIEHDVKYRRAVYRRLYSPSLTRLCSAVNLDQSAIRARGHYVEASGRRLFDVVAGVACSIRGHNPPAYVEDIEHTGDLEDCRDELARRLHDLTGLPHVTPAVSGASAVEQALKIALASQYPRKYVLALQGGFGGKTLFALTGTWQSKLKAGLAPLYPHVLFVDPFAADAVPALESACERYPIAVIQFELIQAVGGVRALPATVLNCLHRLRERHGCLLLADEVQTGMYRTGPFVRSRECEIQSDLLTIGKGTSDMMFPFALTLHSQAVQQGLDLRGCTLTQTLSVRYGYELGVRGVVNTLRRAEREHLSERVRVRGEFIANLLAEQLGSCKSVHEVRCFGLLIGVELDAERLPARWMQRLLPQLSLLAMLHHRNFPLIAGFCQYEPQVLKITPPLSITEAEARSMCSTIASVLLRSPGRLISAGAWQALALPFVARLRRNP